MVSSLTTDEMPYWPINHKESKMAALSSHRSKRQLLSRPVDDTGQSKSRVTRLLNSKYVMDLDELEARPGHKIQNNFLRMDLRKYNPGDIYIYFFMADIFY